MFRGLGWMGPPDEAGHYVNKNVNWVGKRFYVFYIFVVLVGACTCNLLLVDTFLTPAQGWTLVSVVHGLINFTVR